MPVVAYAFRAGKRPEIVASSLVATEQRSIVREFEGLASRNGRCKNPCAHFVLSPAAGEILSREQWQEICQRTAQEFGAVQWVAVLHRDTRCEHVSFVLNRIGLDGKAWSTSNDRYRLRGICRDFEERHELIRTPEKSLGVRIDKDELEKATRLHTERKKSDPIPDRLKLAVAVRAALAQSPTRAEFEQRLCREKITTRWRYDDRGRPVGVSFGRGEACISGRHAGISCQTLTLHYGEKGTTIHEQNDRLTIPGGAAVVAGAIGGARRGTPAPRMGGEHARADGNEIPAARFDRSADRVSGDVAAPAIRTVGDLLCRALCGMEIMLREEIRDEERFFEEQQRKLQRAIMARLRRVAPRQQPQISR